MLAGLPMLALADEYPASWKFAAEDYQYIYDDAADACASVYYGAGAEPTGNYQFLYDLATTTRTAVNGDCEWQYIGQQTTYWRQNIIYAGRQCGHGGTYQSGMCVDAPPCEEGYLRDESGACVPPPCEPPNFINQFGQCQEPCPEAGSASGSMHVHEGGNVCSQSCERKPTKCSLKINIEGPQDGGYVCDYVFTGSSCDWIGEKFTDAPPGPEPQPEPEPEPCGSGKVSGTFNGQTICLDAGENTLRDDTKKETTETTKDDGTKEVRETTTDTRSQFDPKTGKTKTTITETTTTTTVDANGNTTGTNTEIVIRERESSGNNVDRDSGNGDGGEEEGGGTFAGACGIAPVCEGDAVQCAIAAAVFETQCALAYEQQALNEQWTAIETYDGTEEGGALEKKDISEGLSELLDTPKQGPGGGLTDKAYTVFGKTVVLPFSLINQYLNVFYWAMQTIAWLVAVKILRGAVQ